jgi:predicted dehydrogenase
MKVVALRHTASQADPLVDLTVHSVEAALSHEPDLAIVAGPTSQRIGVAKRFTEAGVHLLLEKPVALSREEAEPLAAASRRHAATIAVGYNLRFLPLLLRTKQVCAEGTLGRPLAVRAEVGQHLAGWRPGRDYRGTVTGSRQLGGGPLLELSHEIDYARWLMGPARSVIGECLKLSDMDIDVEDTVDLIVRFSGGGIGSLHMDMIRHSPARRFTVTCQEGDIEGDLLEGQLLLWQANSSRPGIETFSKNVADTYRLQMQDLLMAIEKGSPPAVGLEDGLQTLQIIDAARQAAESGQRAAVIGQADGA